MVVLQDVPLKQFLLSTIVQIIFKIGLFSCLHLLGIGF
jgi:hypothetical protein